MSASLPLMTSGAAERATGTDASALTDSDTDLKIVIYTTPPGSEDENTLQFTRVIGTQAAVPN